MTNAFNWLLLREYGEPHLDKVPREVQEAYLSSLYALARLGGVEPAESDAIAAMAKAIGASDDVLASARNAQATASERTRQLTAVDPLFLIRDAIRLAFSDGTVTAEERKFISDLARDTGVERPTVAWIFSWVERESALRAEWWSILEAGDK
ncbi:MAG: hypothetical protein FJ109_21075 [Deltaproteobacteria bacterium]|nr:hypothetical protein [Deltaproteobacteria bacterium]